MARRRQRVFTRNSKKGGERVSAAFGKEPNEMKIEKKTDEVVYITINGKTVYIDDSTGELIVRAWNAETAEDLIKTTFEQ
jgi:uncharacterized cupin superfamily protein